jgi:hypothetical protein
MFFWIKEEEFLGKKTPVKIERKRGGVRETRREKCHRFPEKWIK